MACLLDQRCCWGWLLIVLGAAVGCGGGASLDPNRPATAPVSGTVTYKGAAVPGAIVTFHAPGDSPSAFGTTDASGTYQLTTFSAGDGAVPGEYRVTVTKTEFSASADVPEDHPDYGKEPVVEAEVRQALPVRYANPETSGLTASVKEGQNQIPLALDD
jgi:hypothetical protein